MNVTTLNIFPTVSRCAVTCYQKGLCDPNWGGGGDTNVGFEVLAAVLLQIGLSCVAVLSWGARNGILSTVLSGRKVRLAARFRVFLYVPCRWNCQTAPNHSCLANSAHSISLQHIVRSVCTTNLPHTALYTQQMQRISCYIFRHFLGAIIRESSQ